MINVLKLILDSHSIFGSVKFSVRRFVGLTTLLSLSLATSAYAEETSWLREPRISPDGRTVAVVVRGQVRLVPSTGGVAVPLTPATATASHPVWSPDGETLAFASDANGDRDVFTVPRDGGAMVRQTFSGADELPSGFSPDGREVLFSAERLGDAVGSRFGGSQLYAAPVQGGRTRLVLPTRNEQASFNPAGTQLVYQYRSSVDPQARQHRVGANANELWLYDLATRRHTPLVRDGKDARNPVWSPDGQAVYYLSERSGVLNVWRRDLKSGKDTALTTFTGQPVRGLSISRGGDLAFTQAGHLYLLSAVGGTPKRIRVDLPDARDLEAKTYVSREADELAISPGGKWKALIARGDIFVVDPRGNSFQVTRTPEEERFVSFSPDGKTLIYASARREKGVLDWRIYQTKLPTDAKAYALAGAYTETLLPTDAGAAQQPAFSPDGSKVAFVYERREVRVLDLASGKVTALYRPGDLLTSYGDGTLEFQWSPDSRHLLVPWRTLYTRWAVVPADGSAPLRPISTRLANTSSAFWSADGGMILALTPRESENELDGYPVAQGLYRIFMSPQSRSDFLQYAEAQEEAKAEAQSQAEKRGEADQAEEPTPPPLPNYSFAEERNSQLEETLLPTGVEAALPMPDGLHVLLMNVDGDTLYLRTLHLLTKETEDLGEVAGLDTERLQIDEHSLSSDGEILTVLAGDTLYHIPLRDTAQTTKTSLALRQQQVPAQMRQAAFDQAWLDLKQTFYTPDLHGVDWDAAYQSYAPYLRDVATPDELTELLDELGGSLNASHLFPFSSYLSPRPYDNEMTSTGSLGIFTDDSYAGPGVRIAALLPGSPLKRHDLDVQAGDIILSVNGQPLPLRGGLDALLDGTVGQRTLLELQRGQHKRTLSVKPISLAEEARLNHQRIIDLRRAEVERLSAGRLAYTYLPEMNNSAFVTAYNDLITMQDERQGAIVDIRGNQGGDLHRQLMNFLTGQPFALMGRKDRYADVKPNNRWRKPSALITDSFAYSDGSVFPQTYQDMKVGPVVGTEQLNTGTAINTIRSRLVPEVSYSIPILPVRRLDGSYYENNVIHPDVPVPHDPNAEQNGEDRALAAAVRALLNR